MTSDGSHLVMLGETRNKMFVDGLKGSANHLKQSHQCSRNTCIVVTALRFTLLYYLFWASLHRAGAWAITSTVVFRRGCWNSSSNALAWLPICSIPDKCVVSLKELHALKFTTHVNIGLINPFKVNNVWDWRYWRSDPPNRGDHLMDGGWWDSV